MQLVQSIERGLDLAQSAITYGLAGIIGLGIVVLALMILKDR